MTREQLDALEALLQHATTEAPEVLDAIRSSIAQAREALELREALDAARAQGRREGLEEAAQVAKEKEVHYERLAGARISVLASGAYGVRRAIRVRINQEGDA